MHPYEAEIGTSLSTKPLTSDLRNHCVPILDVLTVPDTADMVIHVMPLLKPYGNPPFETYEEAVEFFRQAFEVRDCYATDADTAEYPVFQGLHFMHEHHVAHRWVNIAYHVSLVIDAAQ